MSNPIETENYAYMLQSCLDMYPKEPQLEDSQFKKAVLSIAETNLSFILFEDNNEGVETYLGLNEQRLKEIIQLPVGYLTAYYLDKNIGTEINPRNLIPEDDIRYMLSIGCLKEIATCQAYVEALELTGKEPTHKELSLIINAPAINNPTSGNSRLMELQTIQLKLGNDITAYKKHIETIRQMVKRINLKAKNGEDWLNGKKFS